jgi:hypothetical protein
MLNTYIKNRGLSQTIMNNNNHINFNELLWDADYDGNNANINVSSNNNGHKKRYNLNLDNHDLANMLNIPSINMPIHKRLQMDFEQPVFRNEPRVLQIEIPKMKTPQMKTPEIIIKPRFVTKPKSIIDNNTVSSLVEPSITSLLESASPIPNEELLVPITIDENTLDKYTLTPKRRHRHKKTHKTYKVYKKQKSPKRSSPKRSSPKRSSPKRSSPKRSSPKHKSPKHKHKSKTSKSYTLF